MDGSRRAVFAVLAALLAVPLLAFAQGDAALRVTGDVEAPIAPTSDDLRALPVQTASPGPRHVKWLSGIEVRMLD